ncbi:MAG: hypothetical protein ACR2PL_04885 [Dehalococcoidia bacterium]
MATRPLHDELLLASAGAMVNDRLERLLQPTFHRLVEMVALPQGWDSYGADPPSPAAIATARGVVLRVAEQLGTVAGDRVKPFAVAPFDSGVQLEWREAHAEVEIDVDADGKMSYLYVAKDSAERRFEEGDLDGWRAAIDLIAQVLVPRSSR